MQAPFQAPPICPPPTAGRAELLEAMEGNVIAKAAYVGRFRRPG